MQPISHDLCCQTFGSGLHNDDDDDDYDDYDDDDDVDDDDDDESRVSEKNLWY